MFLTSRKTMSHSTTPISPFLSASLFLLAHVSSLLAPCVLAQSTSDVLSGDTISISVAATRMFWCLDSSVGLLRQQVDFNPATCQFTITHDGTPISGQMTSGWAFNLLSASGTKCGLDSTYKNVVCGSAYSSPVRILYKHGGGEQTMSDGLYIKMRTTISGSIDCNGATSSGYLQCQVKTDWQRYGFILNKVASGGAAAYPSPASSQGANAPSSGSSNSIQAGQSGSTANPVKSNAVVPQDPKGTAGLKTSVNPGKSNAVAPQDPKVTAGLQTPVNPGPQTTPTGSTPLMTNTDTSKGKAGISDSSEKAITDKTNPADFNHASVKIDSTATGDINIASASSLGSYGKDGMSKTSTQQSKLSNLASSFGKCIKRRNYRRH